MGDMESTTNPEAKMNLTATQTDALAFLAKGGEQIKIRTARPLVAKGLVQIPAEWQTQYEVAANGGWTRATLTDKGRAVA